MAKLPDDVAIRVENIHKRFYLPRHRSNTFKDRVLTVFQPKDKTVDVHEALQGISFDIKKGEFIGVVGRNGSGKSTLLKIISKIYVPTSGTAHYKGKLVAFIELGVGFKADLSGRENVYLNGAMLGFSRKEIDAMYDEIVAFAELGDFMEQKLKNYSSGMKVRLAFSVAVRAQADILILDEVLAVGDTAFRWKCYDYFQNLKEAHKTIVLVTHNMGLVKKYCDRAILIENGKVAYEGAAEEVADAYTAMFSAADTAKGQPGTRWGSEEVRFRDISIDVTEKHVSVDCAIEAKKDIRDVTMELNVRDGANMVATAPETMKDQLVFDIKAGKVKHMIFTFDNLFGGKAYHINASLKSSDKRVVYDWWRNAAVFTNENRPAVPTLYPLQIKSK
jgi:ABC-2 type transport system ATP-binding protein